MSVSDQPVPFDFDGEEERTVLVQAPRIRDSSPAGVRIRHLFVSIEGESLGQVTVLEGEEIVIGRGQSSTLCIPDSGISRKHARLVWTGNKYILEDLGSANGTYVGGLPIQAQALADGDVVQLGPSVVFRYTVTDADQQAMLEHLYDASVTDALTQAFKRDYFDSRLASEVSYARRHNTELSLIILDVDHFKAVNDKYGHQLGDAALVALCNAARAALRTEDVYCRYGGEEFAIILRTTDLEDAARVAERIRAVTAEIVVEGRFEIGRAHV